MYISKASQRILPDSFVRFLLTRPRQTHPDASTPAPHRDVGAAGPTQEAPVVGSEALAHLLSAAAALILNVNVSGRGRQQRPGSHTRARTNTHTRIRGRLCFQPLAANITAASQFEPQTAFGSCEDQTKCPTCPYFTVEMRLLAEALRLLS